VKGVAANIAAGETVASGPRGPGWQQRSNVSAARRSEREVNVTKALRAACVCWLREMNTEEQTRFWGNVGEERRRNIW